MDLASAEKSSGQATTLIVDLGLSVTMPLCLPKTTSGQVTRHFRIRG